MSWAFPIVVHLAVDFVEVDGCGPMTAVAFLSFIFDINHDNHANPSSTGEFFLISRCIICFLTFHRRMPAPLSLGIMVGDKAISKTSLNEGKPLSYALCFP